LPIPKYIQELIAVAVGGRKFLALPKTTGAEKIYNVSYYSCLGPVNTFFMFFAPIR